MMSGMSAVVVVGLRSPKMTQTVALDADFEQAERDIGDDWKDSRDVVGKNDLAF